jgi:hypothetical protein
MGTAALLLALSAGAPPPDMLPPRPDPWARPDGFKAVPVNMLPPPATAVPNCAQFSCPANGGQGGCPCQLAGAGCGCRNPGAVMPGAATRTTCGCARTRACGCRESACACAACGRGPRPVATTVPAPGVAAAPAVPFAVPPVGTTRPTGARSVAPPSTPSPAPVLYRVRTPIGVGTGTLGGMAPNCGTLG